MIYFVDEDVPYAKEFSVPLVMRGYEVDILPNADRAYEVLEKANNVELAIVDIMLATAEKEVSRFDPDGTDGFLKTGLLLINYLADRRPALFPNRFIVLTAAADPQLIHEIERRCRTLDVSVLRKGDFRDPSELADVLLAEIR